MDRIREIMFGLLCESFPNAMQREIPKSIEPDEIAKLYELSVSHDIAHLIAVALEKHELLPDDDIGAAFRKQKMLAIFRREQIDFEEARICELFEKKEIAYIPLKGAIIKKFYPQPWMRTSCDIDILIHPQQIDLAIAALTEEYGYVHTGYNNRDHSLLSKSGVNLELHYYLISNDERLNPLLLRAWDYASSEKGGYRYKFSDEYFLFHTIAHAQYHFMEGGCGARCLIDLWLIGQDLKFDEGRLYELLDECGSVGFYKGLLELIGVWFEGKPHSELTLMLEDYILNGGMFGSRFNQGSSGEHKGGNWLKYIYSRIFFPREKLERIYPKLKDRGWLLPYYQVKRWFNLFKRENRKGVISELKGRSQRATTEKMMEELGI